jgi:MYXO-CTERM domain-containing protein
MTKTWIRESAWALSLAVACVTPACDSAKPEKSDDVARTTGAATAGLVAGDVAITCINTAGTDFLQVTPLVPIDNDSVLKFTDREASAGGDFNSDNENINVPVVVNPTDAGAAVIPAGTPIKFNTNGLGNPTETVFIYQGTISAAVDAGAVTGGQLLWGFQMSPGGIWVATRDDAADLSALPTVLGGHATTVNSTNNLVSFFYDTTKGGISGTKAQLQAAIANPANWTGSTAPATLCPGVLTVLPDATDAATDAPVGADAGTGGASGADGGTGAGGSTTVTDAGTGGSDAGTATDVRVDTGTTDTGTTDTGATDVRVDTGTTDTGTATDVRADTGTPDTGTATDVRVDTGPADTGTAADVRTDTAVDLRVDSGTTSDARADTGGTTDARADVRTDSGTDAKAGGGSSGCSCSTGSARDGVTSGAWMLALAGVVFAARRRRRRQ